MSPQIPLASIAFDSPELLRTLEASADDPGAYDALPFGIIAMNRDGDVWAYNRAETEFSGIAASRVLQNNFFSDIAPCTNNYLVAGRYSESEALDDTIDYVFTLKMKPTRVRLRLLKQSGSTNQFLAVQRA